MQWHRAMMLIPQNMTTIPPLAEHPRLWKASLNQGMVTLIVFIGMTWLKTYFKNSFSPRIRPMPALEPKLITNWWRYAFFYPFSIVPPINFQLHYPAPNSTILSTTWQLTRPWNHPPSRSSCPCLLHLRAVSSLSCEFTWYKNKRLVKVWISSYECRHRITRLSSCSALVVCN